MEAHALVKRGWSISAIARHLDCDRKTVRSYLNGDRVAGVRRSAAPDQLAPFVGYVNARFVDDPHLWASALFDEVVPLPTVLLDRTATPLTLPAPGGTFTFTVKVTDTSAEEVTITELTDDIYGDISTKGTCTDAIGTVLDADPDGTGPKTGGIYTCSFPGPFNGTSGASQKDVITVTVEDDDGTPATDTDDAVVTITSKPPVVVNQEKERPPPAVALRGPLPRTGVEAARLVTLAGALILLGTLLVGSTTWAFLGLSRTGRSRRRKR